MSRRGCLAVIVVLAWGLSFAQARAQGSLDRGRTPAQLYASDCAECHRNPKLVGKTMPARSLADYLRAHYTASKETAVALADYLTAVNAAPSAASPRPAGSPSRAPAPTAAKPAASPEPGKAEGQTAAPAAKPEASPAKPPEAASEPKAAPAAEPAPASKPAEGEAKPPQPAEGAK
jgi:hypothetical protein